MKQEYEKTTVLLEREKRKMQRLKNRQAYLESGSRKQRTDVYKRQAFMITATFSIGFSYFETYQMQQIRLMGTTADVGITNVTENQLVDISKSNLVLDVGIQQRLGSVCLLYTSRCV